MSNQAKIVISAVDKATATMLRIRANMRAMTQPMRDVKASMGRFAEAAGIKALGRNMAKVARGAHAVAKGVRSILSPMAAFLGVASIAGIVEMSKSWANLGWSIQRTAATLGMAPGQLQALRGAAKLAGLSADDMTSSLHSLGNVMYGAKWGGDTQTRAAMNALGMHFRMTKKGGIDTAQTLMDVSKAVQHYNGNAQLQEKIARQFGVESLLPLLRQGPEAIKKFEVEAKRLGYVLGGDALNKSTALGKSFAEMDLSLAGLRNSISASLFPTLGPLVNKLTAWIAANRVLIGQRVAEWVAAIVQWVRSVDWGAVWRGIKSVVASIAGIAAAVNSGVQALGGWKTAIELIFGAWAIGKITLFTAAVLKAVAAMRGLRPPAPSIPVAPAGVPGGAAVGGAPIVGLGGAGLLAGDAALAGYGLWYAQKRYRRDNALAAARHRAYEAREAKIGFPARMHQAIAQLRQMGFSRAETAGLAANFEIESGMNPFSPGDRDKSGRYLAYGIGQWHANRQALYAKLFGHTMQSVKDPTEALKEQLAFSKIELSTTEKDAGRRLAADQTPAQAGADGSRYYERPKHVEEQASARGALANFLYQRYLTPTAPQRVEVHVALSNAPAGTRVTAKDDHGKQVPVRVSHNLVGAY
jgi:hypothetical protein